MARLAFDLTNQQRIAAGLREFTWDDSLAAMAYLHSADMAERNYFSHSSLEGEGLVERTKLCSIRGWRKLAENIASNRGYSAPAEKSVDQWMNSEGHRRNILDSALTHLGIGVARSTDGTWYFTQDFARF